MTIDWKTSVIERSELLEQYYMGIAPDDSFNWGERLKNLWHTIPMPSGLGVLIIGKDGCGKHTAAAHLLSFFLNSSHRYTPIFLYGDDFLDEGET
jgi:hypothetical protein